MAKEEELGSAALIGFFIGVLVSMCVVLLNPTYSDGKEEVQQEAVRVGVAEYNPKNKEFKWKLGSNVIELQEIE